MEAPEGKQTSAVSLTAASSGKQWKTIEPPTKKAAKPDTGWAWVIAAAAFFIYVNTLGVNRSSGVFYVAVVQTFGVNRKDASWPFTICYAFLCLTGPITGLLNRRFSIRILTLIGCGVCASGMILSYFATNIVFLCIPLGALQGIGLGINMVQNSVILNQYFIRHRATATGIAFAGGNIGGFIYPPLMEYFIHEYGLKGAFLLTGGMMLNTLVAASFYRPPEWLRKKASSPKVDLQHNRSPSSYQPKIYDKHESAAKEQHNHSNDINDLTCRKSLLIYDRCESDPPYQHDVKQKKNNSFLKDREVLEPMLSNRKSSVHKCSVQEFEAESQETGSSHLDSKAKDTVSVFRENWNYISKTIFHPMFVIICISNVSFFWIFMMYVMFIVDFAMDRGISEDDAVFLLSAFGISDILGRLGSGWISDRGLIRRKNVTMAGLLMMSVFLNVTPYVWNFTSLMIVCLLFGFASGCVIILTNVQFADYLGLEKLPLAIGCASFFGGMVAFIRPALIGYFRDNYGSYDGLLHVQGAVALFSACFWFFEPMVQKKLKKNSLPLADEDENDIKVKLENGSVATEP